MKSPDMPHMSEALQPDGTFLFKPNTTYYIDEYVQRMALGRCPTCMKVRMSRGNLAFLWFCIGLIVAMIAMSFLLPPPTHAFTQEVDMKKHKAEKKAAEKVAPKASVKPDPEHPLKPQPADVVEPDKKISAAEQARRQKAADEAFQAEKKAKAEAEEKKKKEQEPHNQSPEETKPKLTYQILETRDFDEDRTEIRVNVILTPPFNGFNEAVITLDVPKVDTSNREQLVREKVAWKANQQTLTGSQLWKPEDAQPHQDVVKETNGPAVIEPPKP